MRIALSLLLASLAAPSIASAQDPAPETEPPFDLVIVPRISVFFASVSGRVKSDEGTFPLPILDGTSLGLESDLDLDDDKPAWIAEITMFQRGEGLYLQRASLSWLEASYDGSTTLDSTENFNGRVFPAGTAMRSECRYRSVGADFTVVEGNAGDLGQTSGSLHFGMRHTDLRISVEGAGGQTDERIRLIWMGGGFRGEARWGNMFSGILQASVYFSFWEFGDEFDSSRKEWGGVLFEGTAALGASIGPLQFEAGLRLITNSSYATVDDDKNFEDNDFLFQLGGPYFSATLRF